jgi:propanol-preferring alcohol dehydrogenase
MSTTATMRAAVAHDLGGPLHLEETARPEPGPGEVVLEVETCGLCHTDIHAVRGDWPVKPKTPLIPGHEGIGVVTDTGAGVTAVKEGDRVALPWLAYACGRCAYCVSGRETLCPSQKNAGYSIDGSYAQYARGYGDYVVPVPDGIDPLDAAPLTCAGVTTYKAVKDAGVRSSDLVAVFGVGGLGHLGVQYARIAGATVVAVDVADAKLETAQDLGATYAFNPTREDVGAEIQKLGGADVAVSTAATPAALHDAFRSLRRGGTLSLVGLPADNTMELPIFETILQGIHVMGSIVGTRLDLEEVFALHADGHTEVRRETRTLDSVNEAFDDVLNNTLAEPRLVFDLREMG